MLNSRREQETGMTEEAPPSYSGIETGLEDTSCTMRGSFREVSGTQVAVKGGLILREAYRLAVLLNRTAEFLLRIFDDAQIVVSGGIMAVEFDCRSKSALAWRRRSSRKRTTLCHPRKTQRRRSPHLAGVFTSPAAKQYL
jgi:hypothetical protein